MYSLVEKHAVELRRRRRDRLQSSGHRCRKRKVYSNGGSKMVAEAVKVKLLLFDSLLPAVVSVVVRCRNRGLCFCMAGLRAQERS